jgi:hypothetical protein
MSEENLAQPETVKSVPTVTTSSSSPNEINPFYPFNPPFKYDEMGQSVYDRDSNLIINLRGWGFLTGAGEQALGMQYDEAAKIQDLIGRHLVKLMNSNKL